jgi:hypothetical protein
MQYAREEKFKGIRGAESKSDIRKREDLRERRKKDRERYSPIT